MVRTPAYQRCVILFMRLQDGQLPSYIMPTFWILEFRKPSDKIHVLHYTFASHVFGHFKDWEMYFLPLVHFVLSAFVKGGSCKDGCMCISYILRYCLMMFCFSVAVRWNHPPWKISLHIVCEIFKKKTCLLHELCGDQKKKITNEFNWVQCFMCMFETSITCVFCVRWNPKAFLQ
jgi:hypothetical protein